MSSYPFPSQGSPLYDQWANTFQCLKDAEADGVLDYQYRYVGVIPRPGEFIELDLEKIPVRKNMNKVNASTMGEYLFLLGYLEKKPRKNSPGIQNSPGFKLAVRNFQKEAGLTVDEWIGDETWRALLALVGIESDTEINRWQNDDGSFCRAFRRAVQLRLWAYGIANGTPNAGFSTVPESSKEKLKKILWCLNIIDDYNAPVPDIILYEYLFDADILLEKAAKSVDENGSFYDPRFNNPENAHIIDLKRSFLVNVAKIEIWLFGGDIKIDGLDNYPARGLGGEAPFKSEYRIEPNGRRLTKEKYDHTIENEIKKYWKMTLGLQKDEIENYIKEITPELFRSFIKPEVYSDGTRNKEEDYSEQIAQKFEQMKNTTLEIEKAFDYAKKLGMIIYDGLKRLWRWIKKGITKVVEVTKNLYRGFFRFANKAYKAVRLAYTSFAYSMSQYLKSFIDIKSPYITMVITKDFDTKVIADYDVPEKDIRDAQKTVQRFGAMFNLSCLIISTFVNLFKSASSGLFGWVRLALTLVKSYRNIKLHYRELSDLLGA